MSLRRHQMILEVEFFVGDDESVESAAFAVAEDVMRLDASGDFTACVIGSRVISFDKEPLPQTAEEIAEDKTEAAEEVARAAEVLAFLENVLLPSPVGLRALGFDDDLFGTLQDIQESHVTLGISYGISVNIPRDVIDQMWLDDGTDAGETN